MAYCTVTDLQNELRDLSKLAPKDVDQNTWAAHMIRRAEAYIDMRLSRRYGDYIPFDDVTKCPAGVPDSVWSLTLQLSIYYCLMSNFVGQNKDYLQAINDMYYRPAVELLNWLSKGNLEIPEIDKGAENVLIDSTTHDYRREFRLSREDSEGNSVVDGNMDEPSDI